MYKQSFVLCCGGCGWDGVNDDCVARDVRLSLLLRNRWLLKEKYAELSCIDCDSLTQFTKDVFKGVFVEALVQGNITSKVDLLQLMLLFYYCYLLCCGTSCKGLKFGKCGIVLVSDWNKLLV